VLSKEGYHADVSTCHRSAAVRYRLAAHHTHTVKNGLVRGKQRYQCRACGYNFVLGDERHSHATEVKKALCLIFYSLGKASCGFLAKLLGVSP
jgi:transposase-like protein